MCISMENIKVEFEVKGFGAVEEAGYTDSYKSYELVKTKLISKDTTLGELEAMLMNFMQELEMNYADPEQLLGKITIRAKKADGHIAYLG